MTGQKDGGTRAWLCVAAVFVNYMLMVGVSKCYSIVYMLVLERYGGSATATAWVGSLNTVLRLGLGPVVSVLINRFGIRPLVIVGAIGQTIAYILSGLSNSLLTFTLTFGLLLGVLSSLVHVPSQIIIGYYFDKRKGLAYAVASSGMGVGTFLLPPLYYYVEKYYGFFGAMLIMGGLCLNMLASGILFRVPKSSSSENQPVDSNCDCKTSKNPEELAKKKETVQEIHGSDMSNTKGSHFTLLHENAGKCHLATSNQLSVPLQRKCNSFSNLFESIGSNLESATSSSFHRIENIKNTANQLSISQSRLNCLPVIDDDSHFISNITRSPVALGGDGKPEMLQNGKSAQSKTPPTNGLTFDSKDQERVEFSSESRECESLSESENSSQKLCGRCGYLVNNAKKQRKKKLFNFQLFRNVELLFLLLWTTAITLGASAFSTFNVALMVQHGIHENNSAILISITGITDILGNFITGAIYDVKAVQRHKMIYYAFFLMLLGSMIFFMPLSSSFVAQMVFYGFYGVSAAPVCTLRVPLIAECVGRESLPDAVGLMLIVHGMGYLVGPFIGGLLADCTGHYSIIFYLTGSFLCICSIACSARHFIHYNRGT